MFQFVRIYVVYCTLNSARVWERPRRREAARLFCVGPDSGLRWQWLLVVEPVIGDDRLINLRCGF